MDITCLFFVAFFMNTVPVQIPLLPLTSVIFNFFTKYIKMAAVHTSEVTATLAHSM